ncbi:DNA alkylation repair protein [Microbacterium sp. CJ77]|uniref:DNA alkylation repair protein n=1 Tax=Microbacterium sp. CJ77 TaxID=2079201 RepID=UPI000CD9CFD3|nr:DNA alkylation repair protein [Microbacterium sp. CJ77]
MPFADELLGVDVAATLARSIQGAVPDRVLRELPRAADAFDGLSLRERADLLRDALLADVPGNYATLARTIRSAAEHDPAFTGWLIWPVTSAVAARAVAEGTDASFDDAMALLSELTGRLTAEFAIRTLLRHDLERALDIIAGWTVASDEHVRRLASEGTRAYLPWAVRVPGLLSHPAATVRILDALYRDDSEYVRRSVANHLNDLSRDSPELVVETARRWLETPAATTPALVRRALRTLVKRGDPRALALLGFGPATVQIDGPLLAETRVAWGEEVRFTAVIRNTGVESARLSVDYVVHHHRANGTLSGKVFKLATADLAPGEELAIDRRHSFRAITTRRYYPGAHAIALQVNGVATSPVAFELLPPAGDAAEAR